MDTKIEDWALYKEWSALSHTEQAQVLAQMSQGDYQRLHQEMQDIKALDAEVQPPSHLRARLMEQLVVQQ